MKNSKVAFSRIAILSIALGAGVKSLEFFHLLDFTTHMSRSAIAASVGGFAGTPLGGLSLGMSVVVLVFICIALFRQVVSLRRKLVDNQQPCRFSTQSNTETVEEDEELSETTMVSLFGRRRTKKVRRTKRSLRPQNHTEPK